VDFLFQLELGDHARILAIKVSGGFEFLGSGRDNGDSVVYFFDHSPIAQSDPGFEIPT